MGGNEGRIFSVDVMRGVSVFGIYLVNMFAFSMPYLYMDPLFSAETSADKGVYIFIDVFAQGSFYPLFAFLFGYSFVLLTERLAMKGLVEEKIILRRMVALFFIGTIHAFLIWYGDILMTYALGGFFLLLFKNRSKTGLTLTGLLLYLIPHGVLSLFLLFISLLVPAEQIPTRTNEEMAIQSTEFYQRGSFFEITAQRIDDWWFANGLSGFVTVFVTIFPLFLIGMAFAKGKRLEKDEGNRLFFKRLLVFALPFSLILKSVPYITGHHLVSEYIQDLFGGPLLAFAYISIFYLAVNGTRNWAGWDYFAAVGRMSLSNYLFQSIVSTFLFYGYGFGLFGKLSYMETTLLAVILFLFQMVGSRFWLKTFRIGPAEWVWRGLTYGKFPTIKNQ